MKETTRLYRFTPCYLPTEGVELLSWARYNQSNAQQEREPSMLHLFSNVAEPKTPEEWSELGFTLSECGVESGIKRIKPEYYNWRRGWFWYSVPTKLCTRFVYEHPEHTCRIDCQRPTVTDRWSVNIRTREGAPFPAPLLAVWPYMQSE